MQTKCLAAYGYAIRAWTVQGDTVLLALGAELYGYPNKTVPLLEMLGVLEGHKKLRSLMQNPDDAEDTLKAWHTKQHIIPNFIKAGVVTRTH